MNPGEQSLRQGKSIPHGRASYRECMDMYIFFMLNSIILLNMKINMFKIEAHLN